MIGLVRVVFASGQPIRSVAAIVLNGVRQKTPPLIRFPSLCRCGFLFVRHLIGAVVSIYATPSLFADLPGKLAALAFLQVRRCPSYSWTTLGSLTVPTSLLCDRFLPLRFFSLLHH